MTEEEIRIIDSILSQNIDITVDKLLKSKSILVKKIAVVDTYNATTKIATVHFLSDIHKQVSYKNKTGETLYARDKVYIFHEYGIEKQGWIVIKA